MRQCISSAAIALGLSLFIAVHAYAATTVGASDRSVASMDQKTIGDDTIVLGSSRTPGSPVVGGQFIVVRRVRTLIGPILAGGSARDEIYVENPTNGLLTVGAVTIPDEDSAAFGIDESQFPLQLTPGAEIPLFFTFHPQTVGDGTADGNGNAQRHYESALVLHLFGGGISNAIVSLPIGGIAVGDTSSMIFASHEQTR